jgi:hypothetical protein
MTTQDTSRPSSVRAGAALTIEFEAGNSRQHSYTDLEADQPATESHASGRLRVA